MIGSYGHDDRVCGYAALRALLDFLVERMAADPHWDEAGPLALA